MTSPATHQFKHVRRAFQQTLQRYAPTLKTSPRQGRASNSPVPFQETLNTLTQLEARLANPVLRIAVFGLVSRGKSAVINALLGETLLPTGPLHGVTRWPRSVYWQPSIDVVHDPEELPQLELIDTPGLDEVGGAARGEMAQEVAHQADLILFVVAGDITRTEYQALVTLQAARKPLLLVFNKTDLYPDVDRQAIYASLADLSQAAVDAQPSILTGIDEIVMVAADPAPMQVRVEWPDGRITHEWEKSPPDIAPLKQALLKIARQDGATLIALNALQEADMLETTLAKQSLMVHEDEAEALIWRFAKYKALAVGLNPVMVLDLLGGFVTDVAMIRALAKLYGLPITQHEARKLWQAIAKSSGSLLVTEIGTGLLMGSGKGLAALWTALDSAAGLAALLSITATQASAAGFGTYAVGKAAQTYLEQGCTWGSNGVKSVMHDVLEQINKDSTLARLRTELAPHIKRANSKV